MRTPRRLATETVMLALAATSPAAALPIDTAPVAQHSRSTDPLRDARPFSADLPPQPPTQVTITRPDGFAWPDALIGAAAAGLAIALVAGGVGLRRHAAIR